MADVVESHEPGRPPSRRGLVAAVAALALIGGVVVAMRTGDDPAREAAPLPPPSPSVAIGGEPLYTLPPRTPPRRSDAQSWTGPHDSLVMTLGPKVMRLRAGETPRELAAAPAQASTLVPVSGGTIVFGSVDTVAEPEADVSLLPTGGSTLRHVGNARYVVAGLERSTVWLARRADSGGDEVRLYNVLSNQFVRTMQLPRDTRMVAHATVGFVLVVGSDGRGGVWHSEARGWRWSLDLPPLSAGRDHVALLDKRVCDGMCLTVEWPLGEGRSPRVEVDSTADAPSVSPDGRWLVAYEPAEPGSMWLMATERATGRSFVVGGTLLTRNANASFAWSRDSRRLYVTTRTTEGDVARRSGQVLGWHVGSPDVAVVLDDWVLDSLAPE